MDRILTAEEAMAAFWSFKGFTPDSKDIDASLHSAAVFFSLPEIPFESMRAREWHIYQAAFWRGAAWMKDKSESIRGKP